MDVKVYIRALAKAVVSIGLLTSEVHSMKTAQRRGSELALVRKHLISRVCDKSSPAILKAFYSSLVGYDEISLEMDKQFAEDTQTEIWAGLKDILLKIDRAQYFSRCQNFYRRLHLKVEFAI